MFAREARGVVLTEAGHILASYAHSAFLNFERVKSELDDLRENRIGRVTICCVEGAVSDLLPRAIAEFRELYPGISALVNVRGTHNVMGAILCDDAEIGISFSGGTDPNIDVIERVYQRLQCTVSPTNPLAATNMQSVTDLADHAIALPDANFGIRRLVDAMFADSGLYLRPIFESNSIEALRQFVAFTSHVLTFMPKFTISRDLEQGRLVGIPIRERQLATASIEIIVRKGRRLTIPAERFISVLVPMLQSLDEGRE